MLLIHNGLFGVVDGSEPLPTTSTHLPDMKLKDSKAKSDLILHCANRQIQLVQSLLTSQEIWDKLKMYTHSEVTSQVTMYQKILAIYLVEGGNFISKQQLAIPLWQV